MNSATGQGWTVCLGEDEFDRRTQWRMLMARRRPLRRGDDGIWMVAGYEPATEILRHSEVGKHAMRAEADAMGDGEHLRRVVANTALVANGAPHRQIRRELAIRGAQLASIERSVPSLAAELVERCGIEVEVMRDLARPLALGVVEELTGCVAGPDPDEVFADASALAGMFEMRADDADPASLESSARRMLEITQGAGDHRPEIAAGYFTTGLETASALSGAAVGFAAADADLWGWLRTADEAERSAYVDEVARLVSPVQFALYSPNRTIEIGTTTIPAGDHLVVLITAANCDPSVFTDPGSIRIERSQRHLAFGLGAHACIGGGVATAQARALLEAVLDRWGSAHVSRASWRPASMIGGLEEIWLRTAA